MFTKFNLIAAVLALAFFTYAQSQGWNLLDNVADSGRGSSGSGRTYHK